MSTRYGNYPCPTCKERRLQVGQNNATSDGLAAGLLLVASKVDGSREYLSYVCRECRTRWTIVRSTDLSKPANFLFVGEDEA